MSDEQVCDAVTGETFRRPTTAAKITLEEGLALTAQEAAKESNELTLRQQADAALTSNRAALAQLVTWRTTGPGAGTANLTAAQSSQAVRTMADNQAAMFRQQNAVIRLLLRRLDGTD
jgi:hypothetical protein